MLIATIRLDHDAVALARAFADGPDMTVEAERVAAHSTEWVLPCLWIAADDFAAVDRILATDPTVEQIIEQYGFTDERYYHLQLSSDVEERVNEYIDGQGSILSAEATDQGWELRFRFVSRDQFDRFRERVTDRGHDFTLLDLTEPGSPRTSYGDLTPMQRDALVAARENGYYEVPREISTRELADKLDMTHQSLSELLRRGTGKLIDSMLAANDLNKRE